MLMASRSISSGNAYIVGGTTSSQPSFPVIVGPDLTWNGSFTGDAFVAKLNAAGTALDYAGYIGGAGGDIGYGIAVDSSGNAYVTGQTTSDEDTFPVTLGSLDDTYNDFNEGFVAKVNSTGSGLLYATYLPNGYLGRAIAVDLGLNAYVTGEGGSGFVYKLNAVGTATIYTTNISGTAGYGIAVDSLGNAYVAGTNGTNARVVSLNAAGSGFNYQTNLGGSGTDIARGIAIDSSGNAFVAGQTTSSDFPTMGTLDTTYGGGTDGFIAKYNSSGTVLFAAYIGGSSFDAARGVAVDSLGNAFVVGNTSSSEASFPVLHGPDLTYNGSGDAFVVHIDAAGTRILYAGYIGGSSNDTGYAIAVDSDRNAYVAGSAVSTQSTFPDGDGFGALTSFDNTYNGGFADGFVAEVAYPLYVEFSTATASGAEGNSGTNPVTSPTLLVSGGIASAPLSVDIALTDGTATLADNDYSQTSMTVTIPAGDYSTVTPISIPVAALGIIGDTTVEPDETLTLALQNASGGAVIGDADGNMTTIDSSVYTILNDDTAGVPTATSAPSTPSQSTGGVNVFDPAISKLGLLVPGQTGVQGEQLEWIITISNSSGVAGQNVTITDTLLPALRIDKVEAPNGTINVNGQTVTVVYPTLNVGDTVQFSIFTTVSDGSSVSNTACVNADNQGAEKCQTAAPVTELPRTGETPLWRDALPAVVGLAFVSVVIGIIMRRHLA